MQIGDKPILQIFYLRFLVLSFEETLRFEYIKSLDEKLDKLNSLISKQLYKEISQIGHHMAGSGESFGFPKISELGAAIEKACETEGLD